MVWTKEGKSMAISLYIVEDYLLTRVGLKHTLKKFEDVEVINDFETAEECIEAMKERPSDMVFMDLGLPGMNGVEATKILKRKYPETKIIILTSHEKDETVIAALLAGANAYCLKDSEEENLINIIRTVKKGALWLAPEIAKVPCNHLTSPRSSSLCGLSKEKISDLNLTNREFSVLKLMTEGKTNPEIAKEMIISTHTVKAHVASILTKLDVNDRVQAAVKAIKSNLV